MLNQPVNIFMFPGWELNTILIQKVSRKKATMIFVKVTCVGHVKMWVAMVPSMKVL